MWASNTETSSFFSVKISCKDLSREYFLPIMVNYYENEELYQQSYINILHCTPKLHLWLFDKEEQIIKTEHLTMFWILEGFWPYIFQRSWAKNLMVEGLCSYSKIMLCNLVWLLAICALDSRCVC